MDGQERERKSAARVRRAEQQKIERARARAEQKKREEDAAFASLSFNRKLDRASKHIEDLEQATQAWLGTDAYRIVAETNPKTSRTVIRAKIGKPPAPIISLMVGDAVHNLRAALDHLALELAAAHHRPHPVPDDVQRTSEFPIFDFKAGSGGFNQRRKNGDPAPGSGIYKLRGIHPDAIVAIESKQPYHRGPAYNRDQLWVIHELDRIDKHRRLNLTTYAIGGVGLGVNGADYFHLEKAGHTGPVHDGTELASLVAQNADYQIDFARDVSLAEPTAAEGEVFVDISRLRDYVRDTIVPLLTPFL